MKTVKVTNLINKNADLSGMQWDDISDDLQDEIYRLLEEGLTPAQAVRQAFKNQDVPNTVQDSVLDSVIATAEATGIKFTSDIAARKWFLSEHFNGDDLNLSQRVTSAAFRSDVVSTIQANLSQSIKLDKMVRELKDFTSAEDVRSGIRDIERQARIIMEGDASGMSAFQKAVNTELKGFDRLAAKGQDTILSRSYERVVKAAAKLKADGLDRAITNAVDKKARYNARRLAHTESARAYGLAARTMAANDEDCTGITWHVASGEGQCDECLDLDGQTFAIDDLPEYPAHPWCHCNLSRSYGPEPGDTSDDYDTDDSTIPKNLIMQEDDED